MTDYLTPSKYPENHQEKLEYIRFQINKRINNKDNYLGIDFCDVGANGIQIRGHHALIKGYCYPFNMLTLKYDFSNVDEVIEEFILAWDACDNKEKINDVKRFIDAGRKYGWD